MSVLLDNFSLPQKGAVNLKLNRSFTINVTAEEAKRQVHHWLLEQVSCNIGAGEPDLAIGKSAVVWRVPAILSAPHLGEVGAASFVDLDVQTGELIDPVTSKERILDAATTLFEKMPAYVRRTEMDGKYIVQDVPFTHTQPTGDLASVVNTLE